MHTIARFFAGLFSGTGFRGLTEEEYENVQFNRAWDRARATANSPSELSEIDAIFARHSI